jgi:hypothetical protein
MTMIQRFRLLLAVVTIGVLSPLVRADEPPVPAGPRFKELAPIDNSAKILIGATINHPYLGSAAETILKRKVQFFTPGNDFKQSGIHPEPGV